MNRKCNLKFQIVQYDLWAQIDRHPRRRYRKVAILCEQQSREAAQDHYMLELCRLLPNSS
jgi:hypothetical protein